MDSEQCVARDDKVCHGLRMELYDSPKGDINYLIHHTNEIGITFELLGYGTVKTENITLPALP